MPKLFLPSPQGEIARPTIGLGLASQAHRSVHQMNYPSKKKKDRQSCGITMFDAVFCVVLLFSAYDATVLNV